MKHSDEAARASFLQSLRGVSPQGDHIPIGHSGWKEQAASNQEDGETALTGATCPKKVAHSVTSPLSPPVRTAVDELPLGSASLVLSAPASVLRNPISDSGRRRQWDPRPWALPAHRALWWVGGDWNAETMAQKCSRGSRRMRPKNQDTKPVSLS